MRCLTAKPIVDGIEKDLAGRAEVIRFNSLSQLGKEAAARFEVRGVPTTLVLDGKGEVIHRHAGIPSRKNIVATAMAA